MNKEAIERTKARCKKEIKGKDRLYVLPGFYTTEAGIKEANHIDTSRDGLIAAIFTLIMLFPFVLAIIVGVFSS